MKKRWIVFFLLIFLSASSILITPYLKKAIASEQFTNYSLSVPLAQASQISVLSSQVTPPLNLSSKQPGTNGSLNTSLTTPFYLQQDFWGKVAIAIISAIATLAANYTLQALKKKEEPKQQLSYSTLIKKGVVEIGKDFQDKVSILYNNQKIPSDLYAVICELKNTGNLPIPDDYIRFEFSKGTRFIDIFEPEPEKETGIQKLENDPNFKLESHELRYKVSSIKKGAKINFRFVVLPTQDESINMKPHNYNGNVEFIAAAIEEVENERSHLTKFITFFLIFVLVPPVFEFIPFFGSTVAAFARFAILFSIYPLIEPLSKILAERILKRGYRNEESGRDFLNVNGSDNSVIFIQGGGTQSGLSITKQPDISIKEKENINELLSQLKDAINIDPNLSSEDRVEALEQIKVLSDTVTNIDDVRTQSSAKFALKILKGISVSLPSTSPLVESGNKIIPLISQMLGF